MIIVKNKIAIDLKTGLKAYTRLPDGNYNLIVKQSN